MSEPKPNPLHSDGVRAYEANDSLCGKLGRDVDLRRDLFTPERIAQSQQVINNAVADYFNDAMPDIQAMHEACEAMEKDASGHKQQVQLIMDNAFRVKGQSETLGFSLIARVSSSLHHYCKDQFRADEAGYVVVRKHIDTLRAAFAKKLEGDGGKLGTELTQSLDLLIQKMAR